MPKQPSRQKRYDAALAILSEGKSKIEDAKSTFEELCDELQSWRDNLPENLQSGSRADELDSAISELETAMEGADEAVNGCDSAEGASPEFPRMY